MKKLITAAVVLTSAFAFTVQADERPDHYEGKPAETLEEAMTNFSETNARVAEILAQGELTMTDLATIHELTYTLENALERIDDEYDLIEDQLEELHLASEGADIEHARQLGETYLANAKRLPQ